jgi:Epoxide hydrolase N terminus
VPDEDLADLERRIAATRRPSKELVADRSQGVQLATMQELTRYWATDHDWRACEARLNALPQFTTAIDGVDIHFIHVKSPHADALPLIMTHGWPGSVIELLGTVGPLTDPTAHGGSAGDAFDLVLPSVPGYGFLLRSHQSHAGPASARAASAAISPFRGGGPRSARPRRCRPFVRPGAGIDRIKDRQFSLLGRPPRVVQRIGGVCLSGLGVIFCHLGVQLVVFAADTVLQILHLRRGIGLHRLPLALRAAGGLPGLFAGRLLMSSDIGLGLLDARPDLRAGFLAGLIGGILQMCDLLLQGVDVLSEPVS